MIARGLMGHVADKRAPVKGHRIRILQIEPAQRGEEFHVRVWSVEVWQQEPVGYCRFDEV